jgi:chromosome segregation ATPase
MSEQIILALGGLLLAIIVAATANTRAVGKLTASQAEIVASQAALKSAQDTYFFEEYRKLNDSIQVVKNDLALANSKIVSLETQLSERDKQSRERDKELGALRENDTKREAAFVAANTLISELRQDVDRKSATQVKVQERLDAVSLEKDEAVRAYEAANRALQENMATIKDLQTKVNSLESRINDLEKQREHWQEIERSLLARAETAERDAATYKAALAAANEKIDGLQRQLDALTNMPSVPTTDPLALPGTGALPPLAPATAAPEVTT